MKHFVNRLLIILFPCSASLIMYGVVYEGLAFGYGLGDIFYLGDINFFITSILNRKKPQKINTYKHWLDFYSPVSVIGTNFFER